MTRQLLQSQRPTICMARWKIEISAVAGTMAVAVMVASLIASASESAAARPARATTAVFSRLSAIPSHNGLYRASLAPSGATPGRFTARVWTLEVQRANGTSVEDATLALESWSPENDRVIATRPRVTGYLGDGRYRVEGLRMDRRGWWNVRLDIAAPGGSDSLAFNLVR